MDATLPYVDHDTTLPYITDAGSFGNDAETLKDRETNDNVTSKDAEIADDAHPADTRYH